MHSGMRACPIDGSGARPAAPAASPSIAPSTLRPLPLFQLPEWLLPDDDLLRHPAGPWTYWRPPVPNYRTCGLGGRLLVELLTEGFQDFNASRFSALVVADPECAPSHPSRRHAHTLATSHQPLRHAHTLAAAARSQSHAHTPSLPHPLHLTRHVCRRPSPQSERWLPGELAKLTADVRSRGLGLVIASDWCASAQIPTGTVRIRTHVNTIRPHRRPLSDPHHGAI